MTRFKKSVLIIAAIAGTGWFVHRHGSAKPSRSEDIRLTQASVDWILFVGMSDWRRAHHASCDQTVIAFHQLFGTFHDAWNQHYRGGCPDSLMTVTSAGPDGVFGTDDDVSNFRRWLR